jgi:putative exosortase-associated protein (TIGR04073 family)
MDNGSLSGSELPILPIRREATKRPRNAILSLQGPPPEGKVLSRIDDFMRNKISLLVLLPLTAALVAGCANTERKLGRGMENSYEIVRLGEARRTVEQTSLFDGPSIGYTTGVIRGFNRTLARTGVGFYEIVTAPFPPYDPVLTDYLAPHPVFPDNYTPSLIEDPEFSTDTNIGFSGGDIAPFVPGSRFRIFDTH